MTAASTTPSTAPVTEGARQLTVVSRKAPIAIGIVAGLMALLLLLAPRTGGTRFRFSAENDFFRIPDVVVPAAPTAWWANSPR